MRRSDKGGLEGRVSGPLTRKAFTQKVYEYFLPFLDEPDYNGMTKSLLADAEISKLGLNAEEVLSYVVESYDANRWLRRSGMLADSVDRLTSIVSMGVEAAGTALGVAPGYMANISEETIEMIFKIPFLAILLSRKEDRHRANSLILAEAATYVLPGVGDLFDIVSNMYMKTAYQATEERARQRILQDFS